MLIEFRERVSEGKREGEKHRCERETLIGSLLYAPGLGPNSQAKHVPSPGIEPKTFRFTE